MYYMYRILDFCSISIVKSTTQVKSTTEVYWIQTYRHPNRQSINRTRLGSALRPSSISTFNFGSICEHLFLYLFVHYKI